MCASPFAPPPERTRAVRDGRQLWAVIGAGLSAHAKQIAMAVDPLRHPSRLRIPTSKERRLVKARGFIGRFSPEDV